MAITFSIDNDRNTAGIQNLTIDQTAGPQTPPDGNDVNLTLAGAQVDGFGATAGALDTGFETYLSGLGLTSDQKNFAILVDGASSSSTFIQATANGGETFTDLRFIDPGASNLITGMQTLAAEALYLHVDASGNFATLTTAAGAGGRIVAAFALTSEVINNVTHVATAGVQMVTFEAITQTNTASVDETLSFTDIIQVGATATLSFNFNQLDAGNFLWAAVGSSSAAMLITGQDLNVNDTAGKLGELVNGGSDPSDTVNTSKATETTIGVNAQHFADSGGGTPTDGAVGVFTFVTGFQPLVGNNPDFTGDDVDDIDYNNYMNVAEAAVFISQLTGGTDARVRLSLWEAGGGAPASGQDNDQAPAALLPEEGYADVAGQSFSYIGNQDTDRHLRDDTIVNVATVTIGANSWSYNEANITTGVTRGGITVTINGNVVTVVGAHANDLIKLTALDDPNSNVDGTFNRIDIQAMAGSAAFDIGHIDLTQGTSQGVGLGSHLFADDDGPSVDLVLNGSAALVLDETDNDSDDNDVGGILATNSITAANYLTTNSALFGTDGQAANNPTVWSLTLTGANANGVDSGLDDAVTNSNVMLFLTNSTTIVGRVGGPAGAVVMTMTINATTGEITVVQNRAVEHNDPNDPDESGSSAAVMSSGLVGAVRTITDGDGDSANDNVDVSQVVKFEDDGPFVDLVLNGTAELRLDETDNDSDDGQVGGILATNTLAAAAYLTTNTANFGSDGQAGANPTVWALNLAGANVNGVDSGLDDAVTNSNVMLFVVNSTTIEGRVGGSGGALVMTISINAGTGALTVTQNRAVEHNDPNDADEAGASSAMMNSGLVSAVRTITDGDGDSASDNVDVSQVVKFEDDGPFVDLVLNGSAELRLDETDNDSDDGQVGGILATNTLSAAAYLTTNTANFGSDGQAGANPTLWSMTLAGANPAGVDSGLDDAVTNSNVMLFLVNSTTIEGRVGGSGGDLVMTITIDAGTGTLTVTQNRAVEHNDPADADEAGASSAVMNSGLISAVRTITDGDGDSASDNVDISQVVKLEDDGPSITAAPNANTITHDESAGVQADTDVAGTAFITGNSGPQVQDLFANVPSPGDDPDVPGTGAIGFARSTNPLVTVTGGSAGSDGPAAQPLTYGLSVVNGTPSGVQTTGGTTIFMYNGSGAAAGLILGRVGTENGANDTANPAGTVAFALAVNPSTGEVFEAQYLSLLHPTGGASSFDESIALASGAVQATVTRTDGDGDTATDSDNNIGGSIKFEDAGPGIAGSPDVNAPNNLVVNNATNSTGQDSSSYVLSPDADGFGSFTIVGPADSTGDFTWAYFNVDGVNGIELNEIKGQYKGSDLYTLELNNDGTYTFKMIGTLPGSTLNLSTAEIKAGAPDTNSIEVGAAENDQFVRISGDSTVDEGLINESHGFVGVDNGNLDAHETLIFTLHNANGTQVNFTGMSIGTKSAGASNYHVVANLVGGGTYQADISVAKNGTLVIDPPGNVLVSSIEVTKLDGSATKIGVGDIDIFTLPNDVVLNFDVRHTDGDGDFVNQSFTVSIDGNSDGNITNPVQGLVAILPPDPTFAVADLSAEQRIEPLNRPYHHDYLMV